MRIKRKVRCEFLLILAEIIACLTACIAMLIYKEMSHIKSNEEIIRLYLNGSLTMELLLLLELILIITNQLTTNKGTRRDFITTTVVIIITIVMLAFFNIKYVL